MATFKSDKIKDESTRRFVKSEIHILTEYARKHNLSAEDAVLEIKKQKVAQENKRCWNGFKTKLKFLINYCFKNSSIYYHYGDHQKRTMTISVCGPFAKEITLNEWEIRLLADIFNNQIREWRETSDVEVGKEYDRFKEFMRQHHSSIHDIHAKQRQ